ncbi:hypothetical protein FACS1894184_04740 [Clostridia bacterium]|nr:hypothetical protein FACS1894184_04740 [Clostridia bacterium]
MDRRGHAAIQAEQYDIDDVTPPTLAKFWAADSLGKSSGLIASVEWSNPDYDYKCTISRDDRVLRLFKKRTFGVVIHALLSPDMFDILPRGCSWRPLHYDPEGAMWYQWRSETA